MKPQEMLRPLCLCALALSMLAPAQAQTSPQTPQPFDFTRIRGAEDADVAVPKASLQLGQKDSAALQAILDFLKATHGASWTGMQATGTFTSHGESSAATLTVLNGDDFRLDVNSQKGQLSIRILGNLGQIRESDGVLHRLPFATAKGGLLAFPRLMANTFPSAGASVVDRGLVAVDGNALHRVTIAEPVFPGQTATAPDKASTVDLYFDPATHLLAKSVASVQIDSKDRARYVQAMTYGDYRQADGILLPFSYTQTLNGQRQWQLQLTAAQLAPQVDPTYFSF